MKNSKKQIIETSRRLSTGQLFNQVTLWLIHHSKKALAVSILFIILGCFLAFQLTIESNMEGMLPSDNAVLKATKQFNEYFPSNETAIVVIESVGNRSASENTEQTTQNENMDILTFIDAFELELRSSDYIENSLYYIDLSTLEKSLILYKDINFYNELSTHQSQNDLQGLAQLLTDTKKSTTTFKKYFKSDDSMVYLIFLKPRLTEDFITSREAFFNGVKETIETVKQKTQTENLNVGLTGGAFIQDIEADTVAFDGIFSTFALTFIAIILFILLAFRKIILPLSTSLPLLGGAILSASFAFIAYRSLNMFSVSFAILLLGLGVDFGVHILSRYMEERELHTPKDALLITLNVTGPSIILGAMTTSLAFYAFVIGKFKAFTQMGVISGTGILILCVLIFSMMPGLILILDTKQSTNPLIKVNKSKKNTPASTLWHISISAWIKPLIKFAYKKPFTVVLVTLLLLIPLFPKVADTKIISDISKIYPENLDSLTLAKTIEQNFDFNTNNISIYAENMEQLLQVTAHLNENPLIKETTSILSFLPENQEEKLEILKRLNKIDPALNFDIIEYKDLDPKLLSNYIGADGVFLIEITPEIDLYQPEAYKKIKHLIFDISGKYPVGMPVIMNEIVALVSGDIITISLLCLGLIFLMLLFMFKKIIDSLITLTPLILSLYTTIGLMNLFSIDINIFSIAAFPLIIGIGIDSSIHLVHRIKEAHIERSFDDIAKTGQAIFITSFTTIIGFFSLTFINHPGMANLGFAVSIGMSVCLLFTLVLIPSLWRLKDRFN